MSDYPATNPIVELDSDSDSDNITNPNLTPAESEFECGSTHTSHSDSIVDKTNAPADDPASFALQLASRIDNMLAIESQSRPLASSLESTSTVADIHSYDEDWVRARAGARAGAGAEGAGAGAGAGDTDKEVISRVPDLNPQAPAYVPTKHEGGTVAFRSQNDQLLTLARGSVYGSEAEFEPFSFSAQMESVQVARANMAYCTIAKVFQGLVLSIDEELYLADLVEAYL